jgi:hypothetical protein
MRTFRSWSGSLSAVPKFGEYAPADLVEAFGKT